MVRCAEEYTCTLTPFVFVYDDIITEFCPSTRQWYRMMRHLAIGFRGGGVHDQMITKYNNKLMCWQHHIIGLQLDNPWLLSLVRVWVQFLNSQKARFHKRSNLRLGKQFRFLLTSAQKIGSDFHLQKEASFDYHCVASWQCDNLPLLAKFSFAHWQRNRLPLLYCYITPALGHRKVLWQQRALQGLRKTRSINQWDRA
jgi:hypothetical protein